MKPVNIKQEVAELEAKRQKYETQVKVVEHVNRTDGSPIERHKHIFIPALNKYYVKDKDHNWFEGECDICK